jgi:hypothetical protein
MQRATRMHACLAVPEVHPGQDLDHGRGYSRRNGRILPCGDDA